MPQNTQAARFLIVDDDRVCVMAMQRAMRKLRIVNEVSVCSDGQHALDFLHSQVDGAGKLPPFIVTLDLNMPRMGGLEFLDAVRADPVLSRLVVFVFTTSDIPTDVQNAYGHNVAGYVVKENPSKTFAAALEMLESFGRIVELPC
ncbi:MAG: response regulator [Sulfitobacter sp.]